MAWYSDFNGKRFTVFFLESRPESYVLLSEWTENAYGFGRVMLTTCWILTNICLQLWQQMIVQTPVCNVTCRDVVWNNSLGTHEIDTHQKTRTDTALAVARGLMLVNFLLESMTVWLWHRPFSLRTGLEKSQNKSCENSNTSFPSDKNCNNVINGTKTFFSRY